MKSAVFFLSQSWFPVMLSSLFCARKLIAGWGLFGFGAHVYNWPLVLYLICFRHERLAGEGRS